MKKIKVAILGSTSHIAKGLICRFLQSQGFDLQLYTRSRGKLSSFLKADGRGCQSSWVIRDSYAGFLNSPADVIINCVGVGTVSRLKGEYSRYFTVTEEHDNLAISSLLNKNPQGLYISFSSGAVYGSNFGAPASESTINNIRVNRVGKEDYYAIARLNSEAKHRSFDSLRIVDLRLFSYFSRFLDRGDDYFMADVINCVLKKKILLTDRFNIVRDYLHPDDLFSMVRLCIEARKLNCAFDVTSRKPVAKQEILDYFASEYGLRYRIASPVGPASATGRKFVYCSRYLEAARIGYKPAFSSLDAIKQESNYILGSCFVSRTGRRLR